MGIISRIFKRRLNEEELAEKSRREKEWAEKCYNKGYAFCERFALDKYINRINDFANTYPRTFFGGFIVLVAACFLLNMYIAMPNEKEPVNIQVVSENPVRQSQDNPRAMLMDRALEITASIARIDAELDSLMAKPSLTSEDSLRVKSLLIQADALQRIVTGQGVLRQDGQE